MKNPIYKVWPTAQDDIEMSAPGSTQSAMIGGVGVSVCGECWDGVSVRMKGECGWVIPFADLERWYLANKALRDAAEKREGGRDG